MFVCLFMSVFFCYCCCNDVSVPTVGLMKAFTEPVLLNQCCPRPQHFKQCQRNKIRSGRFDWSIGSMDFIGYFIK